MRDTRDSTAVKPSDEEVFAALVIAGRALGHGYAYWHRARFHFDLAGGWSIAISADHGPRLRIDACRDGVAVDTLWILAGDAHGLAGLVVGMKGAIARADQTGEVTHGHEL